MHAQRDKDQFNERNLRITLFGLFSLPVLFLKKYRFKIYGTPFYLTVYVGMNSAASY